MAFEDIETSVEFRLEIRGPSPGIALEHAAIFCDIEGDINDDSHIGGAMADTNKIGWEISHIQDGQFAVGFHDFKATMVCTGGEDRTDDVMWAGDTIHASIEGTWEELPPDSDADNAYAFTFKCVEARVWYPPFPEDDEGS